MAFKGTPNNGAHMVGQKVRSAHLGFDCYSAGPMNQRKIVCRFRRHRAPPRITTEVIDMLPAEFQWPTGAHDEAHAAIDAIYTLDTKTLMGYRRLYPEHHFGFEQFIDKALRWHDAAKRHGAADVSEARAVAAEAPLGHRRDHPGAAGYLTLDGSGGARRATFPGWVKHVSPLHDLEMEGLTLRLAIIHFNDNTPALRIDAYPLGEIHDKSLRLSRIYADLVSNKHEVIEHFPGKYRGLGMDPLLLRKILGVTRLTNQRRTVLDHPDVRAARERDLEREEQHPKARALRVLRESRAMQVAADPSGDPEEVFGAHLLPAGMSR